MATTAAQVYTTYNSLPLKVLAFVPFLGNMVAAYAEGQIAFYIPPQRSSLDESRNLLKLKNQFHAIQVIGGVALVVALTILLSKGICPDRRFIIMAYLMIAATAIYNSFNAYCFFKNRHVISVMKETDILTDSSDTRPIGKHQFLRFY